MRYHSLEALLLAVMASLMVIAPSAAIRGSHHHMVVPHRSLQAPATGTTAAPKEPKEPTEKEDKEAPAPKKDANKKTSKKDKKACKKADKKSKKKRRSLQDDTTETEVFEGDVNDLDYCLQAELSAVQCANLDSIPSDGKIVSMLKLELVHNDEKEPKTITEEAEGILDSGETELRFVGCKPMNAPPPPPKKGDTKKTGPAQGDNGYRRRRLARYNQRRKLQTDNHEVEFKSEEEDIDVIGVDFNNLKIVKNGCQTSDAPEGSVCDVIESNVDIFYQSGAGQDPTDDDKEDMHNLLVETIKKQAKAGAFGSLGSVEDVEVTHGRGGFGTFGSSGDGGSSVLPIVLGVVAALVAVGCLYWFCCRGDSESHDRPKAHNEDTSDEEHSSDEDDTRAVPVAEVISVEDPTAGKKDGKSKK